MEADHSGLNNFSGLSDSNFKLLLPELQRMVKESRSVVADRYRSKSEQDAEEQAAVACRNALFLTDPHVDRERVISAKGTRVAGTCEWITRNAKYRAWLSSDNNEDSNNKDNTRLLWISGGLGKGKTMTSILLIEELERHTERIDNAELTRTFSSSAALTTRSATRL